MRDFFKSIRLISLRLMAAIILLLGLFHLVRVAIEVKHIQGEASQAGIRASAELERATQDRNLFSLKKILWGLKSDELSWLSFSSDTWSLIGSGLIIVGDVNSSFFSSSNYEVPLEFQGRVIGMLGYKINLWSVSQSVFRKELSTYIGTTLLVLFVLTMSFWSAIRSVVRLERDLEAIVHASETKSDVKRGQEVLEHFGQYSGATGLSSIYTEHLKKIVNALIRMSKVEREMEVLKARGDLASQVAHDIRSPLSALNMVLKDLPSIPDEKTKLIRSALIRINDIANDLLRSSKEQNVDSIGISQVSFANQEPVMVVEVLESIVKEKVCQFGDRKGVEIHFDPSTGYGLFVSIDEAGFARVISNLVNNAVEALLGGGRISIEVRGYREQMTWTAGA